MSVVIYGAGGHGRALLDVMIASGHKVVGFCDSDPKKIGFYVEYEDLLDDGTAYITKSLNIMGSNPMVFQGDGADEVVIAIGDNADRKWIAGRIKEQGEWQFPIIEAMSSTVSRVAKIGEGTVILNGATVCSGAQVGKFAILNTMCVVEHDCRIGDFAHICPAAVLDGGAVVKEGAFVGTNATVLPRATIGEGAIVGAGAVVTKDVPAYATVVGNPARIVREQ